MEPTLCNQSKGDPSCECATAELPSSERIVDESARKLLVDQFWFSQGWYQGTPGEEGGRRLRASWLDPLVRRDAVRLIALIAGDPTKVTFDDFRLNGLSGLLSRHYDNSPWKALSDAGYPIEPYEMGHIPIGYFESREHRIAAMRWLCRTTGLAPSDITSQHFRDNGIGRVLDYYDRSPGAALAEIEPTRERARRRFAPQRAFQDPEERRRLIRQVIEEVRLEGRPIESISRGDFKSRNLGSMLKVYYGNNPRRAVADVGEPVIKGL